MSPTMTSSLDTEETTDPISPTEDFQTFSRHSTAPEWDATHELYATLADLGDEKPLHRFQDCRKKAWFVQNENTLEIRVASTKCHLRWCPLCADSRQMFIAKQTTDWLKTCHHPKLLTLTLRHTSAPLESQIKFLYESFRQLRKRSYFSKKVTGGIWFFQVKKSDSDHKWHPHLHCTIDGLFLKHRELKNLWIRITRGSEIVHIKPCTNIENSAQHIARYAARPSDLATFEFSDTLEIYHAMKSRRIVGSWGTARYISFRPSKPDDAADWKSCGGWSTVQGMRGFDEDATMIWKAWLTNKPAPRKVSMYRLEQAMAGVDVAAAPAPALQTYLDFYPDRPP